LLEENPPEELPEGLLVEDFGEEKERLLELELDLLPEEKERLPLELRPFASAG
jgi:hypothetical protein